MVYLEYIVLYFRGASFSLRDRKKVQYVSEVIQRAAGRALIFLSIYDTVVVWVGTQERRGGLHRC